VDSHAHLDAEEFEDDLPQVLRRASDAGVVRIVCPALHAQSSEKVIAIAQEYPQVYAAVGIQPNYCGQAEPQDWATVERLSAMARVVALGETGLDRHWSFSPFALQQEYFDRHLWLAQKLDLPVIIHCREAEADLLRMLKAAIERKPFRGVIHAFSCGAEVASEFVDLGFCISFAGAVTYRNRKFDTVREAAKAVPLDHLLVETDSPYLTPEPLRNKDKRNEPAYLLHTVEQLSRLRGVSTEELAAVTSRNAARLFCWESGCG